MSIINCVVLNDEVINIGDWSYLVEGVDAEGNAAMLENPLPEGAVQGQFDVCRTAAGRYVLTSNYEALREAEYPAVGDQLDALYHAGAFPAEMAARLREVKEKYTKQ